MVTSLRFVAPSAISFSCGHPKHNRVPCEHTDMYTSAVQSQPGITKKYQVAVLYYRFNLLVLLNFTNSFT